MAITTETRVGILFFGGLALMLWFALFVDRCSAEPGAFSVSFTNVMGLDVGSAVTYNGVKVGRVRMVTPVMAAGKPMVRVAFDVEKPMRPAVLIGDASTFEVQQGMLGGATLVILGGEGGAPISQESLERHIGKAPVTMAEALREVSDLVAENRPALKKAMDALPRAVDNLGNMSGEIQAAVAENREGLKQAVAGVGGMGKSIQAMVDENRAAIAQAIKHLDGMAAQVEALVGENRPDVREAVKKLPGTVEALQGAAGQIRDAVAENRENLKETIAVLKAMMPKLDATAVNLQTISGQIASGKGSVGKLVMEDTLHDKAVAAVDGVGQRMEEVKPFTSGISRLRFYIGLDGGTNTSTGASTGTAYLRIEPRPWKFYEAGVGWRTAPSDRTVRKDDPDDLKIDMNLMLGWRFWPDDQAEVHRLSVKGGLIEGAFGGQADVALWRDRVTLHLMARDRHNQFDPDDRRYEEGDGAIGRATVSLRVWKRIFLYAGADDVMDDVDPFIGIRAELLDNDIRNLATAASIAP